MICATSGDNQFNVLQNLILPVEVEPQLVRTLLGDESVLMNNVPDRSCAPYNGCDGALYEGINQLILAQSAKDQGFKSPVWMTWYQVNNRRGEIAKGERPTPVQFVQWKQLNGRLKDYPRHTSYHVYNTEQIIGLPDGPWLKHPLKHTKVDKRAIRVIFNRMQVHTLEQELGHWMVAARFGVPINKRVCVPIPKLRQRLTLGNQHEIFRIAGRAQDHVTSITQSVLNFKG